jgi:pimeloyl-ACP methyl ester carboxylesterase
VAITRDIERVIRIPGAELFLAQRGREPRAVFIHGFGGDLRTWDGLWLALGDGLPALRYDLRGYGRSPIRDRSAFDHADDLLALLDALGIDRADLVGASMGGSIAVNFTIDHPDRVRRLVLISPGLVAWEWSDAWRAEWGPIVDRARAGAMDEARRLWWQHPLFETTRHTPGASLLYDAIMRFAGEQWIRNDERPQLPDVERIHLLETPTLLLTGSKDLADFRLVASLLEASAGNLSRIDRPDLGHLLHLEDPDGCAREVLDFLSN